MLNRVTVTGADDSVDDFGRMVEIQKRWPFVEWGILLGSRMEGGPRFPSGPWCDELVKVARKSGLNISLHLCGRPVRQVCEEAIAPRDVVEERVKGLHGVASRVQLNFHGRYQKLHPDFWKQGGDGRQYILQDDQQNDEAINRLCFDKTKDFVPLFDLSGGAGVLPAGGWPAPRSKRYQGYAGGLSPGNVREQLGAINKAAGQVNYWIDAETRLRTKDDAMFDLSLVEFFLEESEPFVG